MGHKKKKFPKERKKRAFVYKPLKEDERPPLPDGDYDSDAYEFFKSVKWDNAWKEFLEYDEEGNFKYKTAWSICKKLTNDKDQQNWLYAAIGPRDKKSKKYIVPYIGDWGHMRSSLFTGEVSRESLLFGNPKIVAVRELIRKHIDVLEISKGFGEMLMGWLARYDMWATQIDERFKYKLFDPNLSDNKNEQRFHQYTKMQEYIFSRTIDCTRQVLRCFGVGKDDLSLLTQMMIANMRERLGDGTARMMMAAASGMKIVEGNGTSLLPVGGDSDQAVADGANAAFKDNKVLATMLGTFIGKAKAYNMEQPDLDIPGVAKDDTSTDPAKDPTKVLKTNGKHTNGKASKVQ